MHSQLKTRHTAYWKPQHYSFTALQAQVFSF